MSTPHTSRTTRASARRPLSIRASARRPLSAVAALFAVLLFVTACGSSDDGISDLASGDEPTPSGQLTGQEGDTPDETPAEDSDPAGDSGEEPTPDADPPVGIPIEMPDLVGQQWYVQSVNAADGDVEPRPNGSVATITFNDDGTVSGNAGCNNFSGEYTIDGAELSISPIAITEMACLIPDWGAFVEFLPQTTGFGSAGGPDPILFVGSDRSISLGSTSPEPVAADPDASAIADYIGLTEVEAAALADSRNVDFRISSIDGEAQMLTMDFIEDRVNVDLVDGVVVSGSLG